MRVPFVLVFTSYGKAAFSAKRNLVIGKASLSKGTKIKSASLAAMEGHDIELNGQEIVGFYIGDKIIKATEALRQI